MIAHAFLACCPVVNAFRACVANSSVAVLLKVLWDMTPTPNGDVYVQVLLSVGKLLRWRRKSTSFGDVLRRQPFVHGRFLLAESEDALWVAFMGTKSARDLLTNAHIMMAPVWPELSPDEPGKSAAAHRGYLSRARGVPVEQLYSEARRRGKRLVLCGALKTTLQVFLPGMGMRPSQMTSKFVLQHLSVLNCLRCRPQPRRCSGQPVRAAAAETVTSRAAPYGVQHRLRQPSIWQRRTGSVRGGAGLVGALHQLLAARYDCDRPLALSGPVLIVAS